MALNILCFIQDASPTPLPHKTLASTCKAISPLCPLKNSALVLIGILSNSINVQLDNHIATITDLIIATCFNNYVNNTEFRSKWLRPAMQLSTQCKLYSQLTVVTTEKVVVNVFENEKRLSPLPINLPIISSFEKKSQLAIKSFFKIPAHNPVTFLTLSEALL